MNEFENEQINAEPTETAEAAEPVEATETVEPVEATEDESAEAVDTESVGESTEPVEASEGESAKADVPAYLVPGVAFSPDTDKTAEEKKPVTGFRVFISIVGIVVAVCVLLTAGYIAGRELNIGGTDIPPTGVVSKPDGDGVLTVTGIFEQCRDSVVAVIAYGDGSDSIANGSGVIYSADGYIITNDHIYKDIPNAKFIIITADGKEYDAHFVGGDLKSDLAVLKTESGSFTPAVFGDSSKVVSGETTVAIGCPSGPYDGLILTTGSISSPAIRVTNERTSYSAKMIQTDAAINPGSSGGGLFDAFGHVIGITASKTTGENVERMGYAIPSNTAVKVATSIIANGTVVGRGKLGITYVEYNSIHERVYGDAVAGLAIQSISAESDFNNAGVKVGDVIVAVNDNKLFRANELLDVVESKSAGEKILLTLYSPTSGSTYNVTVALIEDKGSSSYVLDGGSGGQTAKN